MNDIFGHPLPPERKGTPPRGFAAPPGTGPAGETCGTCFHICHTGNDGKYKKCGLQRHRWTGGPGSDIKSKSPACSKWSPYGVEGGGK